MTTEENNLSDDNVHIIKGRFRSAPAEIYGQFIIIFNSYKEIDTYNIIVSTYSDIYNRELKEEWDKFEEFLTDLKWKGQFNNNLTASLTHHISTIPDDPKLLYQLYDHIYNYDYKNLETILYDRINQILHVKDLTLETVIQEVPVEDYLKVKENRSKPKESTDNKTSAHEKPDAKKITILPADIILAPVKGKPIYDLKIGDIIMVRLKSDTVQSNYYIDDLDLKKDNRILPCPAEVIDIKTGTDRKDPIEILTKLIPGVYCRSYENEKQVKVRVFDPAVDKPVKTKNKISEESIETLDNDNYIKEPIFSKSTLIMLILLFLILAIFSVLILISW